MAITLLFPYIVVYGNGVKMGKQAPTTESLPVSPEPSIDNLILTKQVGVFGPGAYQWINNRWQFVLDYAIICNELFGVSQAYVVMPYAGDNLLPVGNSGAAIVSVYKNGVLMPSTMYSITMAGIALNNQTASNEVYLVMQDSPIDPTMAITGGGGIADAPVDGNPYVRKNGAWENLQSELNEGVFTGQ
jgi:hypothetical protein